MRPSVIVKPNGSKYEYRLYIRREHNGLLYTLRAFTPRSRRGILCAWDFVTSRNIHDHRVAKFRVLYPAIILTISPSERSRWPYDRPEMLYRAWRLHQV